MDRFFAPRRLLFATLLACALPLHAQPDADNAPVVKSATIVDALADDAKDVRLDHRGRPQHHGDPSIALRVPFAFNSAQLAPAGRRQLDELAYALNDKALVVSGFEIAGHTDKVGSAAFNRQLSNDRATAVKTYLVEMHGIAPARLQTVGHGFSRLANPDDPGSAVNRRVEVRRIRVALPAAGGRDVRPLNWPAEPGEHRPGRLVRTPE